MNWTVEDVITTDKYLAAFPADYFKTNVFTARTPQLWRGRVIAPPGSFRKRIICGHSDGSVTEDIVRDYPAGVWWAVNSASPRVRGLPLGITNFTHESEVHPIFGDVNMMVEVASQPRTIKNLAYANWVISNHSSRGPLMEFAKTQPWITVGQPIPTMRGRKDFLQELRNHTFVLCPPGGGVDTHRLWETLYMGSIPIVKQDIAHAGWQDLPILFVDSWDEVTEERLLAEKVRFENTTWSYEKLRVSYWINQIHSSGK